MGYQIYAWLDDGRPKLRIVDAGSRSVCLDWSYGGGDPRGAEADKEIQRLFRELLLLTCRQSLSPVRRFSLLPADTGPAAPVRG